MPNVKYMVGHSNSRGSDCLPKVVFTLNELAVRKNIRLNDGSSVVQRMYGISKELINIRYIRVSLNSCKIFLDIVSGYKISESKKGLIRIFLVI